jgi:two-component system, cell cycle response regulator
MRVVLVDASRTVLKIVSRMLEARDHEVIPFTDGALALNFVQSNPDVAAVITSGELVSMTGIEMCWNIRLLANNGRPIYVVLMSSNYDHAHVVEALDMGADDFIGKPPNAEELYARLRSAERLVQMQNDLIRLASTDPLTGVNNRRAFFERANKAAARAADGERLSAIIFDVDHFKRVNDSFGHDVGDEVLRCITREVALGEDMTVGRLGGEEFAVLLEGRPLAEAVALADQLRLKISNLRIASTLGAVAVTCSFGVGQWEVGDSIDTLLKRVDAALYEAKHAGRNRVVAANAIVQDLRSRNGGVVRATRS